MSDADKRVLDTIATALPSMTDMDKGFLLGLGEALVMQSESQEEPQGA